jgi:hypothetical protein
MKFRFTIVLAILVPIIVAGVFGLMISRQNDRRRVAEQQRDQLQARNSSLRTLIRQLQVRPLANKQIAAEDTPDEQAAFLTQMRVNADASDVKLVRYMNRGIAIPRERDPKTPPPIFKPVISNVEVQGPYLGVRAFAYSLLRANRLMNMSGVTWKRNNNGGTTLSFLLTRYVADPQYVDPVPVAPAVASAETGEGTQ